MRPTLVERPTNEKLKWFFDEQRWELPPWLTEPGRVLIDHCDAILAKADDEGLEPCDYSQKFGSREEGQLAASIRQAHGWR
ncbi:uncharacterized protein METZ01_LOCUS500595 [marine metagenome]|uniref:Uncharacterized protein n=1 Tax=marine metagenome TaxID=408172 RepID=A0A383DTB2_9ZZZZ